MATLDEVASVVKRMDQLSVELEALEASDVDIDAIEARVQEHANDWARAMVARAMKRADTESSEVKIDGEHWGNRRVTPHDYETLFGNVSIERSVYQQSGRGRVSVQGSSTTQAGWVNEPCRVHRLPT